MTKHDPNAYERRRLIERLSVEMTRSAGGRYRIDLAALDFESLRELQRLLRDMEDEARKAAQRARMMPWRTP